MRISPLAEESLTPAVSNGNACPATKTPPPTSWITPASDGEPAVPQKRRLSVAIRPYGR